jgi:hypothetical protein
MSDTIFIENEEELEEEDSSVIEEEYSTEVEEIDFEAEVLRHLSRLSKDINIIKTVLLLPFIAAAAWFIVTFVALLIRG